MKTPILAAVALALLPATFAQAEEPFEFAIGPVAEYLDLKQIDSTDPYAPHDKGWLTGAKAAAQWQSSSGFQLGSSVKYTTTIGKSVTYSGSTVDEEGNATPESDVRSDYKMWDVDATLGWRFTISDFEVTPFAGYKFYRWDNDLGSGGDNINEICTTHGLIYGVKAEYGSFYSRLALISPQSIKIQFNIPGMDLPDTTLEKKLSTNLTLGYRLSENWAVEGYFNRYRSGKGMQDGEMIKTPVDINSYGLLVSYRW